MGRAARARKAQEQRFKLSPEDFFRLLAKSRTLELLRREAREKAAQIAMEIVQKELAGVEAEGKALYESLAKRYGFDATVNYRWDEETCELIAPTVAAPTTGGGTR